MGKGGSNRSASTTENHIRNIDTPINHSLVFDEGGGNAAIVDVIGSDNVNITSTDYGAIEQAGDLTSEIIQTAQKFGMGTFDIMENFMDSTNQQAENNRQFAKDVSVPLSYEQTQNFMKYGSLALIALLIATVKVRK